MHGCSIKRSFNKEYEIFNFCFHKQKLRNLWFLLINQGQLNSIQQHIIYKSFSFLLSQNKNQTNQIFCWWSINMLATNSDKNYDIHDFCGCTYNTYANTKPRKTKSKSIWFLITRKTKIIKNIIFVIVIMSYKYNTQQQKL